MHFKHHNNELHYIYTPWDDGNWINETFEEKGFIKLEKVFLLNKEDLIEENESEYIFKIGVIDNNYYRIFKKVLRTKEDVLIHIDIKLTNKLFTAERGISILTKIDSLLKEQVIIGENSTNSIPVEDFNKLIHDFPTKRELDLYVESRMTNILMEYLPTTTDAQKKLDKYLNKRKQIKQKLSTDILKDFDKEKYVFIYDTLEKMLKSSTSYSENDWQKQILEIILLIYPKYILSLENVNIKDYYSNPSKTTNRFIDITLLDVNGNIDIIEIKKPFDNVILYSSKYRDNYTPKKELSGTVMQVEKYIFHLNKWGINGEKALNKKYTSLLPKDLSIKITNPKAILILGRENDFNDEQLMDFEIIKRKYANVIDLMTYDDLLRRLNNIISKF